MRILYIFYQYPLYLKGSYFQEFLNAVCKKIKKIGLISYYYPKTEFTQPKNLKIYWLKKPNLSFIDELLFIVLVLLKVLICKDLKNYDLTNCIGPRGLLAGWYLKKKYKIPLVCTIEMLNEQKGIKNSFIYSLSKILLTKIPIDKFICWSKYYKQHLISWGIPDSKIIIIPPGIDTTKYHPNIIGKVIKNKYSPKNPLIVFAKPLYLHHVKAVKLIIKAIAILKPKIKINFLVGSGDGKKQIIAYAKKLKILNQVKFMPPIPFPQMPKYLAAADLVVLPFTYAPTVSRSLLEAMAIKKPIITTKVGENKIILKNNHHVLFCLNSESKLAKKIIILLNNKKLTLKLKQSARLLILEKFSLNKIVLQHINCYNQLIKK
ncbi:hypothetical protein A3J78_00365 [Candidatus Beckwithbacteria bacterium RBG_13_35_6]|uniref:Glycosyl transferase family 1 domain-containing protein n=1 Tax=Candidatus Beckwithbacteria bacterium RBG_13_35_6 TaxID=1797456 RepID=A0A1F5DHF8_9BACT|nr:MAG: hypothetical protein A3J78_00365 [Candidatus Beckwithbacteria bacterium RBG_13_35_6]